MVILFCKVYRRRADTAESETNMDKKEQEQYHRQENLNKFNSITQKVKPENQNQEHNVRKEGIGPVNQKR